MNCRRRSRRACKDVTATDCVRPVRFTRFEGSSMVGAMLMAIVYNSYYPRVREVAKTST